MTLNVIEPPIQIADAAAAGSGELTTHRPAARRRLKWHVRFKQHSVLPGFNLSLGYTLLYLSLIVLLPLTALAIKTVHLTWDQFISTVTNARVVAAYKVSFGAGFIAAAADVLAGFLIAWVLVRYRFPGRRLMDAVIDLPFALPTAVAGIALATVYSPDGWIGKQLAHMGIRVTERPLGIVIALMFICLPFIVRTVQPVLEDLSSEVEQAAESLGATRLQIFRRVIMPELWPALLTGFALALARAVGEYGSVIFIAGNMPMKTEIVPLLIVTKLEEYNYAGATAIALVMLLASILMLLGVNLLQSWMLRRRG